MVSQGTKQKHSLVPENVCIRVSAQGAATKANRLCCRLGILGQIRHCQVARLLGVCEAQSGVVQYLHSMHAFVCQSS